MGYIKTLAGAGLALALGIAAPVAWGQTSSGGAAPDLGNTQPSTSGSSAAGMSSSTTPNAASASDMEKDTAKHIDQAKSAGQDVAKAQAEHELGSKALQDGNENEAMKHF